MNGWDRFMAWEKKTAERFDPAKSTTGSDYNEHHSIVEATAEEIKELTRMREAAEMSEEPMGNEHLPEGIFALNTDGGIVAEPNQPEGEAAIGVVITDPDGQVFAEVSSRLGWCRDHHVAEFHAIMLGLTMVKQFGIRSLVIKTDSELLHHTIKGSWKLRPQHLRELRDRARELWSEMGSPDISWVPRETNSDADRLAGKLLGPLRPKLKTGDEVAGPV